MDTLRYLTAKAHVARAVAIVHFFPNVHFAGIKGHILNFRGRCNFGLLVSYLHSTSTTVVQYSSANVCSFVLRKHEFKKSLFFCMRLPSR